MSRPPQDGQMLGWLTRLPERGYRFVSSLTVLAALLLAGAGGRARLPESGLGCSTWPRCYGNDLVAHDAYHSLLEFINRCAITAVAVLTGAVLAPRRRRDLLWLPAGLFAGYLTEAVPGGLTVLARLAPALVAAHLVAAMLVLADAATLHWRAGHAAGPAPSAAGWEVRLLARLLLLVLGAVIVLGTVATGAGSDAGSPDVPRFGFRFQAAAELHAVVVMFLAGLTVAMFFGLRPGSAARPVLRAYVMLLLATGLQSAVGYVPYFGGLPAGLIEAHIAGTGILVTASVRFNLAPGPGYSGMGCKETAGNG